MLHVFTWPTTTPFSFYIVLSSVSSRSMHVYDCGIRHDTKHVIVKFRNDMQRHNITPTLCVIAQFRSDTYLAHSLMLVTILNVSLRNLATTHTRFSHWTDTTSHNVSLQNLAATHKVYPHGLRQRRKMCPCKISQRPYVRMHVVTAQCLPSAFLCS